MWQEAMGCGSQALGWDSKYFRVLAVNKFLGFWEGRLRSKLEIQTERQLQAEFDRGNWLPLGGRTVPPVCY